MNLWDGVLEEYDNILYMPLSSGLSGSYSTAAMLAQEEKYKEKVYVVDHGRISTPLHQSIFDALEMIEEGLSASEIKLKLEQAKQKMAIFIAVDDLKYLRRGGRISSGGDDETTQRWVQDIKEAFPGHEVMCDYLSFGVTCHTGPGALGIGFSCRP